MLPLQPHLQEGDVVSRYRVESLLARGGMGLVYRARDTRLDRPAALKVLSPEYTADARFRERFVRESRLAASVDHPHVIPIYEADDWQGVLYLAMRLVHGVDLHAVLGASGPLDTATTLRVLRQAAAALDAAHAAGLVHRDVKPGNLLLDASTPDRVPGDVHVYLTDFGLTKKASSVSGITATGQFLGTLNYVSPEQIRGEEVDRRTDLYALACMASEMLCGTPPFLRDEDAAVLWAHVFAPPPPVTAVRPDLPPAVDAVVARGMAKEPAQRPATCGEFVGQLEQAVDGGPAPASQPVGGNALRPPHPSLPGGIAVREQPVWPGSAPSTVRHPRREAPSQESAGWSRPGGRPAGWNRPGGRPARPRRRAGWAVAIASLAVVVAALTLWRPWAPDGPERVERELVEGFTASVPADWERSAIAGEAGFAVLAPRDWTAMFRSDAGRTDAAAAVADDPGSVVGVYAAVAEGLDAGTPAALVDLVEPYLVAPVTLAPGEVTRIAGQDAVEFTGTLSLGSGGQVLLRGVVALAEPRLLLVLFAPAAVTDEWRPVFDDVVASVRAG